MAAEKENTLTIKSQHQLNIKHGAGSSAEGAGLCRMFHSEVVVVAVGDVGWSQKHIRLVSGGR